MQYTEQSIEVVKAARKCINRIAVEMDVHTDTVERWLKENKNNGPLTTIRVLDTVINLTGLSRNQILVD